MQLRELNLRACPSEVFARIKALSQDQQLRRRAILIRSPDQKEWRPALITLEAFSSDADKPQPTASVSFDDLVLEESWLRPSNAVDFLTSLQENGAEIGPTEAKLPVPPHWSLERLTANNNIMPMAGVAAEGALQFEKQLPYGFFLNQEGAYFPTLDNAIRHWAPFSPCHGAQDGRLGTVLVLLPETRARFYSVSVQNNTIHIELAGNMLTTEDVQLISAIGAGDETTNTSFTVNRSSFDMPLPTSYDWWDIILRTKENDFLDKWSSQDFTRVQENNDADQSPLETLVRQALETGEGQRVEFKPFIDLPAKKKGARTEKAELKKLSEILQTAAAMANAGGGHIFLGVTDECALSKDNSTLSKWGARELSEGLIDEYRRALLTRLNDRIVMDASLRVKHVEIEGSIVVVIEIPPMQNGVAEVAGDTNYYLRRGASNKRVSPSEWPRYAPSGPSLDMIAKLT